MIDLYAILGITKNATNEDIKKAWRKAAHLHHPDASGSDASSQVFLKAREAYEILGDPSKRAIYDQNLKRELKAPATVCEEVSIRRDMPWKREDALIFSNIVLKGDMILFNSNTLILPHSAIWSVAKSMFLAGPSVHCDFPSSVRSASRNPPPKASSYG